jgi:dihydrofolate reductase
MRRLIVEEWISVDGYVADKQNKLDFFAPLVRASYDAERIIFLNGVDCILFGRKTYEQFAGLWPGRGTENALAEMINQTQKIVFSDTLTTALWGTWPAAEIVRSNASEVVRQRKSLPGKNMIVWGSISLVQTLMKEQLVDEYHLHVCPSMTAGGRKFFAEEQIPATLTLIGSTQTQVGTVLLKYQVKNN